MDNQQQLISRSTTTSVAELLERILDKGVVVAGDIRIDLVDVELLTIRIRLLIASVDKAKEMGINWWEGDPFLKATEIEQVKKENHILKQRLKALEEGLKGKREEVVSGGRPVNESKSKSQPGGD